MVVMEPTLGDIYRVDLPVPEKDLDNPLVLLDTMMRAVKRLHDGYQDKSLKLAREGDEFDERRYS